MIPQGAPFPEVAENAHPAQGRVAVIDIGSNSIRLVVYERISRSPVVLFNEKIVCGLGRGLLPGAALDEKAVALALANLPRLVLLARGMGAGDIDILATAAVREAGNGPDFVRTVENLCHVKVRVLSGEEEARLSALGVVAGLSGADGIMADLGGGSLELVLIDKGVPREFSTLPLGTLRFAEQYDDDPVRAAALIEERFIPPLWLSRGQGKTLYAVGGAWRALARLHIHQSSYPLNVIHHYTLERGVIDDLVSVIGRLSRRSLDQIRHVSLRRAETLPMAALVMERLLLMASPRQVVFSGFGLREGQIYSRLDDAQRRQDPLIMACRDLAAISNRFGLPGKTLHNWTAPLFTDESPEESTLRLAACYLSDIAWREHADYRAEQAFERIIHMPIAGMDHASRIFLALALYARYRGDFEGHPMEGVRSLVGSRQLRRAALLGASLRLANYISGGVPELLSGTALVLGHGTLAVDIPKGNSALQGEAVCEAGEGLASILGLRFVSPG